METLPSTGEMYQALVERDPTYEGVFVVGVRTTGIFCRPACPAKKPKPENVIYFATPQAALSAGYRPCRRCRPLESNDAASAWVRGLLETIEQMPEQRITDADLRAMKLCPTRVRRYFRQHFGMTFQTYHRTRRMGLALRSLQEGEDVTTTGYQLGYDSTSGFRDAFARILGEPPGRGRAAKVLVARWLETPLGAMLAAANDDGLYLLEFNDRRGFATQLEGLRRQLDGALVPGDHPHLAALADELSAYFAGTRRQFTVPLVFPGNPFQQVVWRRLLEIPFGETASYSQLAADIGRAGAARAVGRANGQNRLAIVIPCHRVVRADGGLCGYGGGRWRKQWLLDHERAVAAK